MTVAGETESMRGLKATNTESPIPTETNGFQIAVILQPAKTHDCSGYCTRPDETEQTPAPITLIAHSYGVMGEYEPAICQ